MRQNIHEAKEEWNDLADNPWALRKKNYYLHPVEKKWNNDLSINSMSRFQLKTFNSELSKVYWLKTTPFFGSSLVSTHGGSITNFLVFSKTTNQSSSSCLLFCLSCHSIFQSTASSGLMCFSAGIRYCSHHCKTNCRVYARYVSVFMCASKVNWAQLS